MKDRSRQLLPIGFRRLLFWSIGVLSIAACVFLLVQMGIQFLTPSPRHHLQLVRDIPLPSPLPDSLRTAQNPLAPGTATLFDHFDFQAIDTQAHLLFIAHSGPNPDREQQVNPNFNPATDAKTDGNIIVFDMKQQKVIALLPVPQVAGITIAQDLHKVYAADANDNAIYAIDEQTFKLTAIQLQDNDSPDGIEYDPSDHLIFVSDPGTPANPDKTLVIDRKNQNETVINALTDKVVTVIPLGTDGQWGDDVGHVRFDAPLHRAFLTVQQLPNPDDPNPTLLPPLNASWLVEINPTTLSIEARYKLPTGCITPHGMAIDAVQQIAFIACVDADPSSIIRMDLRQRQAFAEPFWPVPLNPDILVIDHSLHILYVGCGAGLALFKEDNRRLQWLGNYAFGVSTHTVMVDDATHQVYLPLPRLGGRAVLRIMQYDPSGIS